MCYAGRSKSTLCNMTICSVLCRRSVVVAHMDILTDETVCKGVTAYQSKTQLHTLLRLGRGGGGVHIHKGLGAADVAEGDLAQPFQLHIAHTV